MKITYYGHSTVSLSFGKHFVLIDPFLKDNPHTDVSPDDLDPCHILISHAHGDHTGDVEAIAKKSGATVVSSFEIANYFGDKNLATFGMNLGGSHDFPFGTVKFTPAWHSSSFPDGTYGGMPMGMVIKADGKTLYHAGDTALFGDMELIGKHNLDVAFVPIGDTFTMGPDDAVEAIKLLKPKTVVPIHYNTFDPIKQDPQAFQQAVETQTDSQCQVMNAGNVLEL